MRSYKDLIVWQKAFKLALNVYEVTKKFPKEEVYGLTSQMRRCAISIPSNIAEGYARHRRLEYIQFLQIAFASGAELETQLLIAKEIGFIKENDSKSLSTQLDEVMKMLNSLIDKLKRYKTNA
ncbi:four helix bundle protein [Candidatus Curtissbacteria bacterium RIFOXYB1_FULL_41_59]|nr:MAG: four helix bundle protein [Candidatus Curtissbacteria bacterium RIFOXYB1_FULL_41_59]OGE10570.1 MAG: four helix bundle protein [Candidatus Curtissbacteria bacterium RIFOXYC2_FULL_41_11]OGE18572.1 MAG: four helix bundle protein [Candidatus Curtissbacteria bacterium RIFOXYC12_FULL_41_11]